MIRRRGLGFKVFAFTALLIILINSTVLAILYFILPNYYISQKKNAIVSNAKNLEANLSAADTEEECAALISAFAEANNSSVTSFGRDNEYIPRLSSQFISFFVYNGDNINFDTEQTAADAEDLNGYIISNIGKSSPEEETQNGLYVDPDYSSEDNFSEDNLITFVTVSAKVLDGNLTGGAAASEYDRFMTYVPSESKFIGRLEINSTLQPIDEVKTVILSLMPYLLIISIFITLIAAYVFTGRLTKPILKISAAAEKMRDMQPDILSGVKSKDELGQLSLNLDNLYTSLCKNINDLHLEMEKVSYFMRAAGHELKTPITILNGTVEGMIDNVGVYKNREKYLTECKEQTERLACLVNEILETSKLDMAADSGGFEDVDINAAVDETVDLYRPLIKSKHLRICKENFMFEHKSDPRMLRAALSNIISNAVNYTEPHGEIKICFIGDGGGGVLSVENECENIDESVLRKLFEPFFTLNDSRDKTKSGTGLGLYIVKKNLDALNIKFEIDNTDTGFKFSIFF